MWLGQSDLKVTWEPASALNPQLIQDFEEGVPSEVQKHNASLYGYKATTLTVAKHVSQVPQAKKAKNDPHNKDGTDTRYDESIMFIVCLYVIRKWLYLVAILGQDYIRGA